MLIRYRSVKITVLSIIFQALFQVALYYVLGFIVVDNINDLKQNIGIIAIVLFIYLLSIYITNILKARSEYYVIQDWRQKVDKIIVDMSYSEYNSMNYSERLSIYINDIPKIRELVFDKFFSMVQYLFSSIWILVALYKIHYSMVLVALASGLIMYIIPRVLQKRLSEEIKNVQKAKEQYTSKIRELLEGFNTLLENSALLRFLNKSRRASYAYAEIQLKSDKFTAFMSAALNALNFIVTIIGLSIVSYFVILGHVEVGALISVISLLPNFGSSLVQFISEKQFYNSGKELYEDKIGNLSNDNHVEKKFLPDCKKSKDLKSVDYIINSKKSIIGQIELINTEIVYSDKIIRFPKNMIFEKGKKYVIIGESGSGKSSLIKLILGQIQNYNGKRLINGNRCDMELFDSIAYVSQSTFLFNDSLRNNIDLNGTHTDEEIINILENLKLSEFNLDYRIQENGKNLSGGQRQRLAIARSILNDKEVIILDEATANLDTETARIIENYVFDKFETIIMITHHLNPELEMKVDNKILLLA